MSIIRRFQIYIQFKAKYFLFILRNTHFLHLNTHQKCDLIRFARVQKIQ